MSDILICTAKVRRDGSLENCANPRADQRPEATNRHCTSCQTAARKRNEMDTKEQMRAKAWSAGVEAMAEHVARNFDLYRNPQQRFTGPGVAAIIRRCERPKFAELVLTEAAS